MKTVRRNIYAYQIRAEDEHGRKLKYSDFGMLFQAISALDLSHRVMDKDERGFIFMDEYNILTDNKGFGWFKSARIGDRPPVISRTRLTERDNPRDEDEGDCLKTHFYFRPDDGLILIEYVHEAVARIGAIRRYIFRSINNFPELNHLRNFYIETLISRGFLERINEFGKISIAKIQVSTIESPPNDYGDLPAALHTSLQEARASYYTLEARAGRENRKDGMSHNKIKGFISKFLGKETINPTFLNGILIGFKPDGQKHELKLKGCEERRQVNLQADDLGQIVTLSIREKMIAMANEIPIIR